MQPQDDNRRNRPKRTNRSATAKWLLGVALIGCATGLIADAFVVDESLWRPIAIGASGSAFFIGLKLWMSGINK